MVSRFRSSLMLRAAFGVLKVWLPVGATLALGAGTAAGAVPTKSAATANPPKLSGTSAVRDGASVDVRWTPVARGTVELKALAAAKAKSGAKPKGKAAPKRKLRIKRIAAKAGRTRIAAADLRSASRAELRLCRSGRCGAWKRVAVVNQRPTGGSGPVSGGVPAPGSETPASTTPGKLPGLGALPSPPNPLEPKPAPKMETDAVWPPPAKPLSASACAGRLIGSHATYDVGPGKQHEDMQTVPWLALQAGDVVNIHARFNNDGSPKPYRTKVGLRVKATADAPVYINGVTDGDCRRPVIDGDGAKTANDAAAKHFGSYGVNGAGVRDYGAQSLGLFLLWALGDEPVADAKGTWTPAYITFSNLELRGARSTKTFTNSGSGTTTYDRGASAIYAVRVNHLTVENCVIADNDQGVFTNTRGQTSADHSDFAILRRNTFTGNGTGYPTEHNAYIQGRRALYEGNFFGQVWGGSSLKDRSSGTVVRYNHILSSARAIDLVETEEEYVPYVALDPLKDYAWVYGNVVRTDIRLPLSNTNDTLAGRPFHFGHDNNSTASRGQALFFYGNTYYHRAPPFPSYYYTTMFQVGGNDDDVPSDNMRVEASGNMIWEDDGSVIWRFNAGTKAGRVLLRGTNFRPANWDADEQVRTVQRARRNPDGSWQTGPGGGPIWDSTNTPMVDTAGSVQLIGDSRPGNLAPLLDAETLRPLGGSPALDRGITGPSLTPPGATAANLLVDHELTYPVGMKVRTVQGAAMDLGALEGG